MTELQKLGKAIEAHRKAGEELQRQFEEYKNKENIAVDPSGNWGLIAEGGRRYVLANNGRDRLAVEWKSFTSAGEAANGTFATSQEAIDSVAVPGYKVVRLAGGPKAVAKFLLGED